MLKTLRSKLGKGVPIVLCLGSMLNDTWPTEETKSLSRCAGLTALCRLATHRDECLLSGCSMATLRHAGRAKPFTPSLRASRTRSDSGSWSFLTRRDIDTGVHCSSGTWAHTSVLHHRSACSNDGPHAGIPLCRTHMMWEGAAPATRMRKCIGALGSGRDALQADMRC